MSIVNPKNHCTKKFKFGIVLSYHAYAFDALSQFEICATAATNGSRVTRGGESSSLESRIIPSPTRAPPLAPRLSLYNTPLFRTSYGVAENLVYAPLFT
ncbi:unnamed protein product [Pieris macdunnoughi]|uniref:Uncharacterized protein n=1 Tax=Pieris macdunnoughi TaxID=345717 RepID=A0A821TW02_9NEOP|nr:unnamed protein product [Pieris macdunnoughi]